MDPRSPMSLVRFLVVAGLASGTAGVVLGAAYASLVPLVGSSAQDLLPMPIPNGRLGDEVEYLHVRQPPADRAVDPSKAGLLIDGSWVVQGAIRYVLDRPVAAHDPYGTYRDAVLVRSFATHPISNGPITINLGEAYVPEYFANWSEGASEAVDLTNRLAIQQSTAAGGANSTIFMIQDPRLDSLRFQNRTVRLGEDLDRRTETVGQDRIEHRTWVAKQGTVAGRDAYGILREVKVSHRTDDGADRSLRNVFLYWVTPDRPYPVVFQTGQGGDTPGDTLKLDETWVLTQYRPGSTEIPWLPFSSNGPRSSSLFYEPSHSSRHPTDGVGAPNGEAPLPYPLSMALEDVAAQTDLVAFHAWNSSHPQALLVAAHLIQLDPSEDRWTWHLLFAEPAGSGFEIEILRSATASAPRVREVGTRTVPSFVLEEVPVGPTTVASAVQAWRVVASQPFRSQPANYVRWGFQAWKVDLASTPGGCALRVAPQELGERRVNHPELFLASLSVGRWGCAGTDEERSIVTLATPDGRLAGLAERSGAPSSNDQFVVRQSTGPASIPAGRLAVQDLVPRGFGVPVFPAAEGAAWASGSLFLAFLATYFLPLLKFELSRLGLVVGYSKLRREEILDNRVRDALLQAIQTEPGLSVTDLRKRVDAGWGTTVYHLSVLERSRHVSSVALGRHRRFFAVGLIDASERSKWAMLQHPRARNLYRIVQENPGIIQRELASRVALKRPVASWHLKRLEREGLVRRERDGRRVLYYPGPPLSFRGTAA